MHIKRFLAFHISVPVFFGLSALGLASKGIYAPAFLCSLFCFLFTRFGWRVSINWLQLPESFFQFRWWCAAGAFLIYAAALSVDPAFRAEQAKDLADRAEQRAVRAAQREAETARRTADKDPFDHLFSAWDGSCLPLVNAVKTHLRDPASFQHIKTGFYRNYDAVHVTMDYRAKNGFGGYAIGRATANISATGIVSGLAFAE